MRFLLVVCFFLALILSFSGISFASDWEMWYKGTFSARLTDLVDFKIEPEMRFKQNFGHFYFEQTYVGLVFKLAKWAKVATLYDRKVAKKNDKWPSEDIGVFDLELKSPAVMEFIFDNRCRGEYNFTKQYWVYRNRLRVTRDVNFVKGLSAYAYDEIFYDFAINRTNENRTSVGLSQKITKNISCGLSYILRYKWGKPKHWYSANILQLDAAVKF